MRPTMSNPRITQSTFYSWIAKIDSEQLKERNSAILNLHLQCRTQGEIAKAVGMTQRGIGLVLEQIPDLEKVLNLTESEAESHLINKEMVALANFQEPDFAPPVYNVWAFGKKTNTTEHFGNTEQRIVDNLIWL